MALSMRDTKGGSMDPATNGESGGGLFNGQIQEDLEEIIAALDVAFPGSHVGSDSRSLLEKARRVEGDLMADWSKLGKIWRFLAYQIENGWQAESLRDDKGIRSLVEEYERAAQAAPRPWFCMCCGSALRSVPPEDPDWGAFTAGYAKAHGTEWFLCTSEDCTFSEVPLVLCNPVTGWDHPAGDNFALAFVK